MGKFKYRNVTDQELTVIGVGKVEPGQTIETDEPVQNPNLQLVDGGRMVNVEAPVEQPKVNKTFKGQSK